MPLYGINTAKQQHFCTPTKSLALLLLIPLCSIHTKLVSIQIWPHPFIHYATPAKRVKARPRLICSFSVVVVLLLCCYFIYFFLSQYCLLIVCCNSVCCNTFWLLCAGVRRKSLVNNSLWPDMFSVLVFANYTGDVFCMANEFLGPTLILPPSSLPPITANSGHVTVIWVAMCKYGPFSTLCFSSV